MMEEVMEIGDSRLSVERTLKTVQIKKKFKKKPRKVPVAKY